MTNELWVGFTFLRRKWQFPGFTFLEKEMAIHSRTIAWKILWTEEPGRLQPMGSQRVGHDWATSISLYFPMGFACLWFSLFCKFYEWDLERKPGKSQTSLQQVVPEDAGKFIESSVKIVLPKISYLPNHLLICENNTKFSDKQRMQKKHHIHVLQKITLRCTAAR